MEQESFVLATIRQSAPWKIVTVRQPKRCRSQLLGIPVNVP